jgi:hypothetical protein
MTSGQKITEHQMMGQWVFRTRDPEAARSLFAALPPALSAGAELLTRPDGGELRTPRGETAAWLRGKK